MAAMASDRPPNPTIADLVELAAVTQRDRDRPRATLHRRDREVGRHLAHLRDDPPRQLVGWLRHLREPDDGIAHRVTRGQRAVSAILVVLGLALGWGVATVVLWYDGTHPVNVINVLGVFVGLQLLLLLPLLAAAAKRDLAWFSPARLVGTIAHLLPERMREALGPIVGSAEMHQQVYGRVQKWTLLRWAQVLAVAFNVAVLVRFLQLVFFSDLAFAWSTTLQVDEATVYAITQALSLPWWWLQDAAPGRELIEQTRYFRLRDAAVSADRDVVDPRTFGGWWPFLLMCLLAYGLLPRLVAYGLAAWRQRSAIGWTMRHTPDAAAVLDRLNNAFVETRSEAVEPDAPVPNAPEPPLTPTPTLAATRPRAVVNWAGVPLDEAVLTKMVHADEVLVVSCGGARSLEEDRRSIATIAGAGDGGVVVVTKSWEPPLLELVDFLGDLRTALGVGVPVTVTPIALDREGRLAPPDPTHLQQWQRRVRSAGDAWTQVATLEGGAA